MFKHFMNANELRQFPCSIENFNKKKNEQKIGPKDNRIKPNGYCGINYSYFVDFLLEKKKLEITKGWIIISRTFEPLRL